MRRALSALRGCRGAGPHSRGHLPDSALPSASAGGGWGLVASRATTHPAPVRGPLQPLSAASPAQGRAGTHLKQRESEAQRGPATSPRSHSAAARSGGHASDGPRAGARPRYSTHSRSCPRAPAPLRTPSGQRPWCAAGPGAPLEGRPGTAWAEPNWSRVGTRGPRRGAGSAWGTERPLIAAGGRAERRGPSASRFHSRPRGARLGEWRTQLGHAPAAALRGGVGDSATSTPPPTPLGPAGQRRECVRT